MKRVSSIIFDITNFLSGNRDLDDFLIDLINLKMPGFIDKMKNIDKYFLPCSILDPIYQEYKRIKSEMLIKWIPCSQFTNIEKVAEGGFGIIYQATWLGNDVKSNETVILKRFKNSQDISKYFLNEVNILIFISSV